MASKNVIGGYKFNDALARGLQSTQKARNALRRILDENPGPMTEAQLLAKAGVELGEIESALNELQEIGRQAKQRTTTK